MSESVKGFKVLPIKFSSESTAQHVLFIKENSMRMQCSDKPAGRTLFVVNVPPYCKEKNLKHVFSVAGKIELVLLQSVEKNDGFKKAYIVYENFSGVASALKLKCLIPLSSYKHSLVTGTKKWLTNYNCSIVNNQKLQKEVDIFMKKYDKETRLCKEKESNEVTDDEGWTVVSKSSRNPGIFRKESTLNKITDKRPKELRNFYTFQIRESKMKHLAELRKKYEEDKKKIFAMKQARKFKPF